jgi:predicted dinucleotide-binding enzyme
MNVGILGAGAMAEAIGQRLVANGHALFVSYSRDPNKLDRLAITLGHGTRAGEPYDAARFGDVLLLATGWQGAHAALEAADPPPGTIVWSIVNPLKSDLSGLEVGTTTSGTEELARAAPAAVFVGAWPPFANVLTSSSTRFSGERPTLFFCGDDATAKQKVALLLDALDVDAVDAGPLHAARFIEPAMLLLVHLAYAQQYGQVAAHLLRR